MKGAVPPLVVPWNPPPRGPGCCAIQAGKTVAAAEELTGKRYTTVKGREKKRQMTVDLLSQKKRGGRGTWLRIGRRLT